MTSPLLTATSLTRRFDVKSGFFSPTRSLWAVNDVDLVLHPGETLGLAGESGCGKSTVAKLVMGLIPPSSGTITYAGMELASMTTAQRFAFRKNVQMVFQDPFSSLNPRMRVGDIIGEPLVVHRLAAGPALRERVLFLMEKVGLAPEQYDRYPHEFSGGQRQRIGIARTLAAQPRLVIADEPVSALDLSIQAQIINLLRELREEFALSFLFIAHDLSVVRHMSDRIAIMYLGRIVECAPREELFGGFLHPYTEALLSAIPEITPGRRKKRIILAGDLPSPVAPPSGCPFHTRCPYAEALCTQERPPLEEKEPGHTAACHFSARLFR